MNLNDDQLGDTMSNDLNLNYNKSQESSKNGRSHSPNDLNENNIKQIEGIDGLKVMDEDITLNKHDVMYTFSSKRVDSNHQIQEMAYEHEEDFDADARIENITLSNINQSNFEPNVIAAWQAYDHLSKDFEINPCNNNYGLSVTGKG